LASKYILRRWTKYAEKDLIEKQENDKKILKTYAA